MTLFHLTRSVGKRAGPSVVLMALILPLALASCVSPQWHGDAHRSHDAQGIGSAEDMAAIERAFENWYTAWETKDYKLAAKDYSDDAFWVNAFGMKRIGKKAIEVTLREVFAMDFVMAGQGKVVEKSIRFVRPDVALVTNRVERVGQETAAGEELATRKTTHLRVFVKNNGTWRIVSHLISDARDKERPGH